MGRPSGNWYNTAKHACGGRRTYLKLAANRSVLAGLPAFYYGSSPNSFGFFASVFIASSTL